MANYKVLVILGQSNQSGEAALSGFSTAQKSIKSKVRVWYNNSLEYLEANVNNRRRAVSEVKGGLEIELATRIQNEYNGDDIIFLKHEEGGTSVAVDWVPTSTDWKNKQYAQFKARLDSFEAYMAKNHASDTYEYVALIWNQGEQDGTSSAYSLAYETNCAAVWDAVRTDTGEAALPIYDWYLSDLLTSTYKGNINTAKTALQVTYSSTIYDTDAADGYSFQDAFHYDADTYTLAGSDLYDDLITNGDL